MREVFIKSASAQSGDGVPLRYDYSIVVDDIVAGNFSCESYGIKIREHGSGAFAMVPRVTVSGDQIEQLLHTLISNVVTPVSLPDVIDDLLACI